MKAPPFWFRPAGWQARLLAPVGALYGAVTLGRMARTGVQLPCPVICVGNPTLGGVGKTPTVRAIADHVRARGKSAIILSRGYGGALKGPVEVDIGKHTTDEVGDEPLMLAQTHRVIVSRDRHAGGLLAAESGADVIVMDDGFQNPTLIKDFSILVIDAAVGLGNGTVFPAGPLRAPWLPQLAKADAVLALGEGDSGRWKDDATHSGKPFYRARLQAKAIPAIIGRNILAFCAIGRPAKFADTLAMLGAGSVTLAAFADHHPYDARDCLMLLARAEQNHLQLATTEKDAAKLQHFAEGRMLLAATQIVEVSLPLPRELCDMLDRLVP